MEILAPVGGGESLVAAVRAGADAVYLGLGDFNARRNAENFGEKELKEAVKYCKVRGVKVYLTLNTLIYAEEMPRALKTAQVAAKAGVDGIIIADLGLAKNLRKMLPEMPLHASTQMTVHTADALNILKELGFSRIVPSREMSEAELEGFIRKAHELGIEVEVFAHGALCMSMSGGCLMSAYLGGRSGNRGFCAGTCRLPFSAKGKAEEYALSLKDLCLIEHIERLRKIGVDSLKIEGRMKPPEYVAAAVSAYRERLDERAVSKEKLEILEGVFSRSGFTDGYFAGERRDMFGVRSDENLILSRDTKNKTHEFYRAERQSVPIDVKFQAVSGEKTRLIMTDGKMIAEVFGDIPEKALNRPIDEVFVLSQMEKLGSTPYYIRSFSADIGEGLSLRAAALNDMRRRAAELLSEKRGQAASIEIAAFPENRYIRTAKDKFKLAVRVRKAEMLEGIDLRGIEAVIISAEEIGNIDFPSDIRIIADIPAGMSDKKFIENCFKKAAGADAVYARNLAAVEIARAKKIPFIAASELNILNPESLKAFEELGASGAVLSMEAKLSDFGKFPEVVPLGAVLFGKTKLMLARNCPVENSVGCKNCEHRITDRKSVSFPVFCRAGFAEIYNSRPIFLADRSNEFSALDFGILDFVDEEKAEIERIIEAYLSGNAPKGEYTRGLYFKGVY